MFDQFTLGIEEEFQIVDPARAIAVACSGVWKKARYSR